jgi:hypothetical protein
VLGEREAVVVDVRPVDIHGLVYADVTIAYPDRSTDSARLGPEAYPAGLRAGERVLATKVVNMVIALRRAGEGDQPQP